MFYLRLGHDTLEESKGFRTLRAAIDEYRIVAVELFSYGQTLEASVHIAADLDGVAEYPDYVLSYDGRVHRHLA